MLKQFHILALILLVCDIVLCIFAGYDFLDFIWIFSYVFMKDIYLHCHLIAVSFWFWYQEDVALIKEIEKFLFRFIIF